MYSGRERKSRPPKKTPAALIEEAFLEGNAAKQHKQKKGGKNKHFRDESDEFFEQYLGDEAGGRLPRSGPGGSSSGGASSSENLFVRWEELLASRESLKRRLDTICAVHGWEPRGEAAGKSFLGGVEPASLLQTMRAEIRTLDPAADGARGCLSGTDDERHRCGPLTREGSGRITSRQFVTAQFVTLPVRCGADWSGRGV